MVSEGKRGRRSAIVRPSVRGWTGRGGGLVLYGFNFDYLAWTTRACGDAARSLSQWLCGGMLGRTSGLR